jgi:hypothetical protein
VLSNVSYLAALLVTSVQPRQGRDRTGLAQGSLLWFCGSGKSLPLGCSLPAQADGGLCSEAELPRPGNPLFGPSLSHGEIRWLWSGHFEQICCRLDTLAQGHLSRAGGEGAPDAPSALDMTRASLCKKGCPLLALSRSDPDPGPRLL